MPTIEENLAVWGKDYHWADSGDEWSAWWGGTDMQWFGSILPRLHCFLPANHILEIAPGFGRLTQFLKDQCKQMTAVDLNAKCIEACKQRFSSSTNITYHVNDGKSLDMVADKSVDFLFSWDSLVHVEIDAVEAYLRQFPRVLTENGVAFIHHSNFADCQTWASSAVRTPTIGLALRRVPSIREQLNPHWRATSVSARRVAEIAKEVGLRCVNQELINWGGTLLNDCFSTLTPENSFWRREPVLLKNSNFMAEAGGLRQLSQLYGAQGKLIPGNGKK